MAHVLEQVSNAWKTWDSYCSSTVRTGFARLGFTDLLSPPSPSAVADLPFVSSPTPLLTTILGYLLVVLGGLVLKNGKLESSKRDPRWVRVFVQAHNVVLIVLSAYMCLTVLYEAARNGYSLWGNQYNVKQAGMARVVYIFYVSKAYEFLDTVIMIIKGNMRQVSFLHVYHHVSISLIWWAITYVAPGGDAYFSVAFNSLVHVVMYLYYFLAAAIGKENTAARKKWLWWGHYLTMFQMFQFFCMLLQAIYCRVTNTYNAFLSSLLFWYMLTLLALFGNFFAAKYLRKGASSKKTKAQ